MCRAGSTATTFVKSFLQLFIKIKLWEKFTHQLDDYYYPSSEFHTIPSLFSIF